MEPQDKLPSPTCQMIDGRVIAAEILRKVGKDRSDLGIIPHLVVFQPDNDSAHSYTREIERRAKSVGIKLTVRAFGNFERTLMDIREVGADPSVDGILLQTPFPLGFDRNPCVKAIESAKDVDGANPLNLGKLIIGDDSGFIPCTAQACLEIIRSTGIALKGAHAVLIGQSPIVGRPLTSLLIDQGVTVVCTHIDTRDTAAEVRKADIVVVAVGRPGLVKADWIKPGAVVVDVGITEVEGKILGDVDPAVCHVAGHMTPVPGGVGPVTTSLLLRNTLLSAMRAMIAKKNGAHLAVTA